MSTRRREPIATDESTVFSEPDLDAIVVKDSKGNRCFPDPPCTNERNGFESFSGADNLFD